MSAWRPLHQRTLCLNSTKLQVRRSFSGGVAAANTKQHTEPDADIPAPTRRQLRVLALHAAIPMVGFGFMDNLVMIQAGDIIDNTFGVAFGLSTLTAAGFGQCFSDVAGITCGGIVDASVARLNLPTHNLTTAQRLLKPSRIAITVGGCIGVLIGCLLGMSCLLFMDTDKAEREKKSQELTTIFASIMKEGHLVVNCERATLWIYEQEKHILWSRVATGLDPEEISISDSKGIVGECARQGVTINIPDAYADDRFDPTVDKKYNFRTHSIIAVPVKHKDSDQVIGVIQMMNKRDSDQHPAAFTQTDETLLNMLSHHVAAFVDIVG